MRHEHNRSNADKKRTLESGQSLVEMSLGFVFFLVVILGVLDLGRLFFIYVALEDSAGEAALYLALNGDCPLPCTHADADCSLVPDTTVCNDPNNAFYRARNASSFLQDLDWSDVTIEHTFIPAGTDTEAMVEVAVEYPFSLLTPIITDIVGDDTFVLRAEATHVLISN